MIDQIMIAVFGVTAVAITQSGIPKLQKWAGVFGLIGQPFWFYSSYTTEAWGIFALSFLYTVVWGFGFYKHWIKKPPKWAPIIIPDAKNIKPILVVPRIPGLKIDGKGKPSDE